MMRNLLAGAAALGLMTAVAQAQPPLVWDGVVVPTDNTECISDQPISWRATYRPYISDEVSGANQPSQLVVFSMFQRNAVGLRLTNTGAGQFNGNTNKDAISFFVIREQNNKDNPTAAGGGTNRTIKLVQKPNVVNATTKFVKITGTIVVINTSNPGLNCATAIRGVFVQRTQPAM